MKKLSILIVSFALVIGIASLALRESIAATLKKETFPELISRASTATFGVGLFKRNARPGIDDLAIPLLNTGFFINESGLFLTSRENLPIPLTGGNSVFIYQDRPGGNGFYAWSSEIALDLPDLGLVLVQFPSKVASRVGWLKLSDREPLQGEDLAIVALRDRVLSMSSRGTVLVDPNLSTAPKVAKSIATNIDIRSLKNGDGSDLIEKRIVELDLDFAYGFTGAPLISASSGRVVGLISNFARKPQGMLNIPSSKTKKETLGVELDNFTYGISIAELIPRLKAAHLAGGLLLINWPIKIREAA